MVGQDIQLIELLRKGHQFVIPPYQRSYQWTDSNWQTLIRDIMNVATRPDNDPPHWMGIFLMSAGKPIPNSLDLESIVVDGQQRLVTIRLWLAALEHAANDVGSPLDPFEYAELSVQDSDRSAFKAALNNEWRNPKWRGYLSEGPMAAYAYFRWVLWQGESGLLSEEPIKFPFPRKGAKAYGPYEEEWTRYCEKKTEVKRDAPVDPAALRNATLKRLSLFSLAHQPRIDEPQAEIFDTLNGARTPLEPLDHVRNSLFVRITKDALAQNTYKNVWEPLEKKIRAIRTRRIKSETLFLYDYLISQGQQKEQGPINSRRGAAHFARMTSSLKDESLVNFIQDNVAPSMACWPAIIGGFNTLEIGGRTVTLNNETQNSIKSICELSEGPAVPAILLYMVAYVSSAITEASFRQYLHLIESYIVRWILVGRPLSPLRSRFMQALGEIGGRIDFDVLKSALYTDWPNNQDIKKQAINDNYPYFEKAGPSRVGAILRGIERSMSGPGSNWFQLGDKQGQYTIEHIYPQNGTRWEPELRRWRQSTDEMKSLLHTLGNLTVVTFDHNRSVGNSPFKEKKKFPASKGAAAPLKLNDNWLGARSWTAREIRKRTDELISHALSYWPKF